MSQATEQYGQLVERVDRLAARVTRAHRNSIHCRSGCSGCCHQDLTVLPIEAAYIRQQITGSAPSLPAEIRSNKDPFVSPLLVLDKEAMEPCALLDHSGQCRIYPARPIICRTQGLPILTSNDNGDFEADCCPLNFDDRQGLLDVPSEDFLSLEVLNAQLVALNMLFVQESSTSPDRVSLSRLAQELDDDLD